MDDFMNLETVDEVDDDISDSLENLDDNTKSSAESTLQSMGFEIPDDNVLLNESLARLFFAVGLHSDFSKDVKNVIRHMTFNVNFDEGVSLQDRAHSILIDCLNHYESIVEEGIAALKDLNNQKYFSENTHAWKDQALAQIKASAANEEAMSFSVQSLELLRNYCDNGLEIDYEDVLNDIIISNPDNAVKIRQNVAKYKQILEATANIYVSCMNRAEKEQERAANISDNTVVILDRELKNIQKIKELHRNNSLDFIRQVYESDGYYYLKCPRCGKVHEVKSLFTLYVIGDINSQKSIYVPALSTCECGVGQIISYYDIISLRLSLVNSDFKEQVNELWKNAPKNTQSGYICRYKLSLMKTKTYLPQTLFIETDEIFTKNDTGDKKEVTQEEIAFTNMNEYEEALDLLYNTVSHLPKDSKMIYPNLQEIYDGFSIVQKASKPEPDLVDVDFSKKEELYNKLVNKQHDPLLVQSTLAVHVAKTLGKEYKTLKNQAVLSLLYSIQSNKIVEVLTDCEKYNQYYAHLQTLKTCMQYNKNNLPLDLRTELINLYTIYGNAINSNESDDVLCTIAMSSLDLLVASLEKRISEVEKGVQWVKDTLYSMKEVVAYTKILNINTSRLDSLAVFLDDEQFSRYCNEIADKMIITNYVERTLTKSVVNKLESVDDALTLQDMCIRLLKSQIGEYPSLRNFGSCSKYCETFAENYFPLLKDTSLLGCSILGDVYDALKEFNLFLAAKLVAENEFDLSQFNEQEDGSLGEKIRLSLNTIKDFYNKYLSDKMESKFYYSIAGFQEETDNDLIDAEYHFDHYAVLKRKPGESFSDYKERLNHGENNYKDFVHTSEYFSEVLKDFYVIQLAGTILRTEIKSFIKTSYAVSLYNLFCVELESGSTCNILGIKPQVYQEYLSEVHEVDLFFKNGKHYPGLADYTANQELTLALVFLTEKYDNALFVNIRDDICLSDVIGTFVEEFSDIILGFEERQVPLGIISRDENEIPIIDYSAQELITDLERFLGTKE